MSEAAGHADRRRRWKMAALWAFPLVLWFVSTGFFLFDLGKYSDDWAVSLRVPETDAYAWPNSPWERWNYFWRPLHLVGVYGLGTAFWHHDWVNHLVSALAHLGVGVLLWKFLRRIGASAAGTSAAASVFLTFPISYEAVLWPAAMGSVVSVGWFLMIALMCVRLARIERVLTRRETLRWCGALAGMSFLCACWHEQGAACVAALPLVMMAARPEGLAIRLAVRRAAIAMAACGLGCLVYVALLMGTVPRGRRGAAGSLVGADDVGARAGSFARQVGEWVWREKSADVFRGFSLRGADVLWQDWKGIVTIGVLAAVFLVWALLSLRGSRAEIVDRSTARARGWLVITFGAAICAASLLPVAMVRQNFVFSRYFYPTGLGLAVVIVGVELFARNVVTHERRVLRRCGRLAWVCVGGVTAAFVPANVGWQDTFRACGERDAAIARHLRGLLPDPPRNAVFVPREIHNAPTLGVRVLGALEHPWSCWAFVQRAYGRSDISATHWRPGAGSPVVFEEGGVRYRRGIADWKGRVMSEFAEWERVVVFTVDERGVVRVVGREEAMRVTK